MIRATLAEVIDEFSGASVFAVDAPIGLLDRAEPGGRACDREARGLLGPRASCVFNPPTRAAVAHAGDYPGADAANRGSSEHGLGLSKQCFNIFGAIRQAEDLALRLGQSRVVEVHPELCFLEMNGGRALLKPKKSVEGQEIRRELLRAAGFGRIDDLREGLPRGAFLEDDLLDACAACWTAGRVASGEGVRIPREPGVDSVGLRMEMWR